MRMDLKNSWEGTQACYTSSRILKHGCVMCRALQHSEVLFKGNTANRQWWGGDRRESDERNGELKMEQRG